MGNSILAFALAFGVVAYWAFCRHVAIKHQAKAAELVEAYLSTEGANEVEKDTAYVMYRMARMWLFMPIMAVLCIPFLPFMLLASPAKAKSPEVGERQAMIDAIMQMYVARNPITSVVCIVPILLVIAVVAPVGLLLDRIKSIPSVTDVFGGVADSTAAYSVRHHAR